MTKTREAACISCCVDVLMNDERTKGREKRDDNHSSRRSRRFARFGHARALLRADALRPNRVIAYDAYTKEGSRQITKG